MLKQKDIETLKEQLIKRREELFKQASSSETIIKDLLSEDTYDELDYAEVSTDSYNLNAVRNKQLQEIREIDMALKKIEDKTYGICEMCDDNIGLKRLRIKPHARFCVECRPVYEKSLLEKGNKK